MKQAIAMVLIGLAALPAPASAQSKGLRLRGIRIEANAGSDRFSANETGGTKFGYGAAVGVDGEISRFVIGVEASYWRDSTRPTNCLTGGAGTFCSTADRDLGAAVRAGYAVSPALLLFGKAGVVRTRQREVFTSAGGLFYVNGQLVAAPPSTDARFREDGYELGGGVEYSLSRHFYADAQYVHSRYRNRTSRNRVMAGLGYRF
jgi:outer membrane immunogenic protein